MDENWRSPLSHFDPADFLDKLCVTTIVVDAQLCVVHANRGALKLFGVSLTKMRGRPLRHFLHASGAVQSLLDAAVVDDSDDFSPRVHHLQVILPDGRRRDCRVRICTLSHESTGTHLLLQFSRVKQPAVAQPLLMQPLVIQPPIGGILVHQRRMEERETWPGAG